VALAKLALVLLQVTTEQIHQLAVQSRPVAVAAEVLLILVLDKQAVLVAEVDMLPLEVQELTVKVIQEEQVILQVIYQQVVAVEQAPLVEMELLGKVALAAAVLQVVFLVLVRLMLAEAEVVDHKPLQLAEVLPVLVELVEVEQAAPLAQTEQMELATLVEAAARAVLILVPH